jgi:hypothetical protein
MSARFAFKANEILHSMPSDENWILGSNSFSVFTTPLFSDPISDTVNNVRFAHRGFAGVAGLSFTNFSLRTFYNFVFQPQKAERLVAAHTHFLPQGGVWAAARKGGWFPWEDPGLAWIFLDIRMRVQVFTGEGTRIFRAFSQSARIFSLEVEGGSVSVSNEAAVESDLLEFTRSVTVGMMVAPPDTIEVQARYILGAFARGVGEYSLDFTSVPAIGGNPGDGLNCPMAVINVED